ncbi:unnamed protein product, partial [Adineta steineri]
VVPITDKQHNSKPIIQRTSSLNDQKQSILSTQNHQWTLPNTLKYHPNTTETFQFPFEKKINREYPIESYATSD